MENMEMTPEVVEANGNGTNALGVYLLIGATAAIAHVIVIPVINFVGAKIKNRKQVEFEVVE